MVETIEVLKEAPSGITVNPNRNMIYISFSDSNAILVIDGDTNKVSRTIKINKPRFPVINPITNTLYVLSDGIAIIDGTSGQVIDRITNPLLDGKIKFYHETFASIIGIHPIINNIYFIKEKKTGRFSRRSFLSVVDSSTKQEIVSIEVGKSSSDIAVNPKKNLIYVSSRDSNSVSIIDASTNSSITDIKIKKPIDVIVNPTTDLLYVRRREMWGVEGAGGLSDSLYVINGDTNSILNERGFESSGDVHAINEATNRVYVKEGTYKNRLLKLDELANKILEVIDLGERNFAFRLKNYREAIAVNHLTNKVYVTDRQLGILHVTDG